MAKSSPVYGAYPHRPAVYGGLRLDSTVTARDDPDNLQLILLSSSIMSRDFYSEIHLHVVWHTKESAPLLTPQVELFVHRYLKQRLVNTPGAFIHEIGGTETH